MGKPINPIHKSVHTLLVLGQVKKPDCGEADQGKQKVDDQGYEENGDNPAGIIGLRSCKNRIQDDQGHGHIYHQSGQNMMRNNWIIWAIKTWISIIRTLLLYDT